MGLNADPALVVKEFARTRRNRTILATAVAVLGFPALVLPDLEAGGIGAGSAIYILILGLAYYRILRSRKRENESTEWFPTIAAMVHEIRTSPEKLPEALGYHAIGGWLVKRSFLTFDFVPTSDICWVYGRNTKHYTNFIPTGTTHSIEARLQSGRTLKGSYSKGSRDEKLSLLRKLAPWAIFGYTEELERAWRRNRGDFIAAVERRTKM